MRPACRTVVCAVVASVCLFLAPRASYTQTPAAAAYVDRPVASIAIEIEGRASTDATLLEAVQAKVGAPLKMADVRETITHLYNLGRFEDVRVEATTASGGGVGLRFVLSPIHTVTKVLFQGDLGLSDATLRARMIERFGETPALVHGTEVASAITELLRDRGYLSAAVTLGAPVLQHEPEQATLIFNVKAGPRTLIGSSVVAGHPLEPAAAIQSRLQVQPGEPYQPGELRTRLADFVTAMRRRKYLRGVGRGAAARLHPGSHPRRRHDRRRARSAGDGAVHRRSALEGQDRRARPDRARGLGRSGSARRLGAADHRLPESGGLLEGGGRPARTQGSERPAHAGIPRQARSDLSRRALRHPGVGEPVSADRRAPAAAEDGGGRHLPLVAAGRDRQRDRAAL